MGSAEKLQSSAPSAGAQLASGSLPPPSSLLSPPTLSHIYPHTPPPHTAVPLTPAEPIRPSTSRPTQPSTPLLPPSPTAPSFASVVGSRQEQSQSTLAVQDGGADFTVVDRKKMRKGTRERSGSKQHALRGTGVNIYCRWAPTGIAKLWVSLPK